MSSYLTVQYLASKKHHRLGWSMVLCFSNLSNTCVVFGHSGLSSSPSVGTSATLNLMSGYSQYPDLPDTPCVLDEPVIEEPPVDGG